MITIGITKDDIILLPIRIKKDDGTGNATIIFKVDTGANVTLVTREQLTTMGYSESRVEELKRPVKENVETAVGKQGGFYTIPGPVMDVGGDKIKLDRLHVTDAKKNYALLGMNALRMFNMWLNFESVPGKYPYGRVSMIFRGNQSASFNRITETFENELEIIDSALLGYLRSVGGIKIKSLSPTEKYWMSCSDFRVDINELNALVKAGKVVIRDGCYIPV